MGVTPSWVSTVTGTPLLRDFASTGGAGTPIIIDTAASIGYYLNALNVVTALGVGGGGTGTVTSTSVATANGVSGTVATPTTTPAITLTLGAITPSSVAATGAVTGTNLSGTNTGDQTLTLTGNITGSGTGSFATTIAASAVTRAMMAATAGATILGSTAAGAVAELTAAQSTALLNNFTATLAGHAPLSGGGTVNFLRADGTWAAPAGGGTVTSVSVTTANGISGTVATATSTPAITLTLGAITPSSISTAGQITSTLATGTAPLVIASTTQVLNLQAATAGSAPGSTLTGTVVGSATSTSLNSTILASSLTSVGTLASPVLTTPAINGLATGTGVAAAATASTIALRNTSANLLANSYLSGLVTIPTAAGTTTLLVGSAYLQQFTGTTTQTVVLPDATTLTVGQSFLITNRSTGVVTVNANGGGLIQSLPASSQVLVSVVTIGTAAGTWDAAFSSAVVGGGSGTVTSVSVTTANGVSGSVATATTTPAITVTLGAITPTTVTPTGQIAPYAGSTTVPPVAFPSGSVKTTAAVNHSFEYDANVFYMTPGANSERGVVGVDQLTYQVAAYTLTSQTAAQKAFNGSTNGTVAVGIGTYEFTMFVSLTAMSATSGSFGAAFGGTATFTQAWATSAIKTLSLTNATAPTTTFNTAANIAITTATTTANGLATITGTFKVTVAGTIIPQISLGVAAAAVVGAGSYFRIRKLGNASVATVGNWT
jgi:hypothetical protein